MAEQEKYVNPNDILNPDAEPLSDERTREVLHDSYRRSDIFIKQHMDPPFINKEIKLVIDGKEQTFKTDEVVVGQESQRPWGNISFTLLKQPIAVNGDPNKMFYGYYKLRGPGGFKSDGEAEQFATKIFQSHDAYSKMFSAPYGVTQPIMTHNTDIDEEQATEHYRQMIAEQKDKEDRFVVQQRLAEEQARKLNEETTDDGTIDDYVRQQLRWHAADMRIQKYRKQIEEAERVMDESSTKIEDMLTTNPEYKEDGFRHFAARMVEVGEREPESYYDQNLVEIEKEDLPSFFK